MKKLTRFKKPTVGLIAAVAAGAIAAGPANAAHSAKHDHPSIKHGVLSINGTPANDKIALRLKSGDHTVIEVDFGDDGSADFSFNRADVSSIVVDGKAGDDLIRIDEVNGVFTETISTTLKGGDGNDTLRGGSGPETLRGGHGNDTIDGNRGNDTAFMGAGDDTFIWDPGDGSDIVEGQDGADTMLFNGANVAERIDVSPHGRRVIFFRDVANITMNLNEVEQVDFNALGGADNVTVNDLSGTDLARLNIDLGSNGAGDGAADSVIVNGTASADKVNVSGNAGAVSVAGLPAAVNISNAESANHSLTVKGLAGDDELDASGLAAGVIKLTLDGGADNDKLAGSQDSEQLLGGDGNDVIDGNRGNDTAFMGAGDDTFIWDPGDGSDVVEGQDGADTMRFNGANIAEKFDASANGNRLRFTRDIGNIVMDTDDVERVDLNALGSADLVTVNDLTGTDVTKVNVDLGSNGAGDGAADSIIVNGTAAADAINISGSAGSVKVAGLAAEVDLADSEPANDTLTINALAGADVVNASGLAADSIKLVVQGGDDADVVFGSAGNDVIDGDRGNDTALMGTGDDTFIWDPGDGSDVVEGQAGFDTMRFNGANVAERFELSANGNRLRFTRDIGNIVMDTNDLERVDLKALGSADLVTVNDLSGTDVTKVDVDLGANNGGGDGAADNVVVNGTAGDDVVSVSGGAGAVNVAGLAALVSLANSEPANDSLTVNALGGDDVVDASGLAADAVKFIAHGGDGDDVLIGSAGDDSLFGEAGDDVLLGGPGLDALDGGPGNNILIQD